MGAVSAGAARARVGVDSARHPIPPICLRRLRHGLWLCRDYRSDTAGARQRDRLPRVSVGDRQRRHHFTCRAGATVRAERMRVYSADVERSIRAARLAKDWMRSGFLDGAQYERLAPGFVVDLRRTNIFLRLTLFAFGVVIIAAAVGLVLLTAGVRESVSGGVVCLIGAAACVALAELLVGQFRLYRFGIEEACMVAAVILIAVGSALVVEPLDDHGQLLVATV